MPKEIEILYEINDWRYPDCRTGRKKIAFKIWTNYIQWWLEQQSKRVKFALLSMDLQKAFDSVDIERLFIVSLFSMTIIPVRILSLSFRFLRFTADLQDLILTL